MAGQKKVTVRLEPPYMAEHPLIQMGCSLLNSDIHGPLRFSPLGVACGPLDNPAFVPWAQVSGVQGWEPPEPSGTRASGAALAEHAAQGVVPLESSAAKGKFKP